MSRFDKYMTVPFVDCGRSMCGADCFGLHVLILMQEAQVGVHDPMVAFRDDGASGAVAAELARGHWQRVGAPQMFDAAVMKAYFMRGGRGASDERHIGTIIDGGRMIHTEKHTGPRIVTLDDPDISRRILFFARPSALVDRRAA